MSAPPTLRKMCMINLVKQIQNLPPMLLEEVVKTTRKEMMTSVRKEITDQIYDELEMFLPYYLGKKFEEYKCNVYERFDPPNVNKRIREIGDEVCDKVIQLDKIYTCRGRYTGMPLDEDEDDSDDYYDENSVEIDYP